MRKNSMRRPSLHSRFGSGVADDWDWDGGAQNGFVKQQEHYNEVSNALRAVLRGQQRLEAGQRSLTNGQHRLEALLRSGAAAAHVAVREPVHTSSPFSHDSEPRRLSLFSAASPTVHSAASPTAQVRLPDQREDADGGFPADEADTPEPNMFASEEQQDREPRRASTARMSTWKSQELASEAIASKNSLRLNNSTTLVRFGTRSTSTHSGPSDVSGRHLTELANDNSGGWIRRYLLRPDSRARLCLDMVTILALLFDSISIPYNIAWGESVEGTMHVLSLVTVVFWMVDLVAGFVSGYYEKGVLVLDLWRISKRYMRTWFIPNALAVGSDLLSLTLPQQENSNWVGLLPRVLKLQRLLVVAAKLLKWSSQERSRSNEGQLSQQLIACKKVVQLVLFLLWLSHIGACIWRLFGGAAIGSWQEDTGMDFAKGSLHDYLYAYLWSTHAMLAGGLFVQPTNPEEVIVGILIIQLGLVLCSVITGILADTLLAIRISNKDFNDQTRKFKQYMSQNGVPPSFAASLEREVIQAIQTEGRITEQDVVLMKRLSQQSKDTLLGYAFGHLVRSQTFIRSVMHLCPSIIGDICANALETHVKSSGETVFEVGTEARGAYMVMWGSFEHIAAVVPGRRDEDIYAPTGPATERQTSTGSAGSRESLVPMDAQRVQECRWICQLALFCELGHSGSMMACSKGECLMLEGSKFRGVVHNTARLADLAHDYGRAIMDANAWTPSEDALSDLNPGIDHALILAMMPLRSRRKMSRAALDLHQGGPSSPHAVLYPSSVLFGAVRSWSELGEQVSAGDCDMVVDSGMLAWNVPAKERAQRWVSVITLRLSRADGRVLVQLGKFSDDGRHKVRLMLPERAIRAGEGQGPMELIQNLIGNGLERMRDSITLEQAKVDKTVQTVPASASSSVDTKYFRHEFCATLSEDTPYTVVGLQVCPMASMKPRLNKSNTTISSHSQGSFSMKRGMQPTKTFDFLDSSSTLNLDGMGAFLLETEAKSPAIFAWMLPEDLDDPAMLRQTEARAEHFLHGLELGNELQSDTSGMPVVE